MGLGNLFNMVNSGALQMMINTVRNIGQQKGIDSAEYSEAYTKLSGQLGNMSEAQQREFSRLRTPTA